jgi:hypothetical protein
MSCTAAAEGQAAGALLEGRRGLETDIGEKRLGRKMRVGMAKVPWICVCPGEHCLLSVLCKIIPII